MTIPEMTTRDAGELVSVYRRLNGRAMARAERLAVQWAAVAVLALAIATLA